MIYDVHTHVGIDTGFFLRRWWPYASTAHELLLHMQSHKVGRAVVFPFGLPSAFDPFVYADKHKVKRLPGRVPFDRENDLLLTELHRIDTGRQLLMLAMFDPSREVGPQVDNIIKLAQRPEAKGRLVGLKVQATILESPLSALLKKTGRDLMLLAEERRWPVLVHTSILPSDHWSPAAVCVEIAATYPKARFNLAHSIRFHRPSLEQAAKLKNVWIDCSAHLIHCELAVKNLPIVAMGKERVDADYRKPVEVLKTIDQMLGGRYMWGSDNPFMSWCDDEFKLTSSYKAEADVLHALPAAVKKSMGTTAPEAWLKGK
jgi:hypothetical protein